MATGVYPLRALMDTIEFYMGRNTQERRQYIMDNLVITEESLS